MVALDSSFNKKAYVEEIINHKNKQQLKLISKIDKIRDSYAILRAEDKVRDENFDTIMEALASDDLETFYPFFSMKSFNKACLAPYNWKKEQLVSTSWFKEKIQKVLT